MAPQVVFNSSGLVWATSHPVAITSWGLQGKANVYKLRLEFNAWIQMLAFESLDLNSGIEMLLGASDVQTSISIWVATVVIL